MASEWRTWSILARAIPSTTVLTASRWEGFGARVKPISLPFAKIDKKRIISSTEALKLKEIPKKLIVIGGGVIGLELGQFNN